MSIWNRKIYDVIYIGKLDYCGMLFVPGWKYRIAVTTQYNKGYRFHAFYSSCAYYVEVLDKYNCIKQVIPYNDDWQKYWKILS